MLSFHETVWRNIRRGWIFMQFHFNLNLLVTLIVATFGISQCSRPESNSAPHDSRLANVFGEDDRKEAPSSASPFSAIGRLDSGCTGTLIAPQLVLTAAHCLIDNKTGRLKPGVTFFRPAYGATGDRERKVWISEFWFGSHNPEDNRVKDFAVIRLASSVTGVGFMRVAAASLDQSLPAAVTLAGYSVDKQGGEVLSVHSRCTVQSKDAQGRLLHDCDSTRGVSGAPLFRYDQQRDQGEIYGLTVSEFRVGMSDSVFRDAYSSEYANVGISSVNFAAVVSQLLAEGTSLSAATRVEGAFYMKNTNPSPPPMGPSVPPAAPPAVPALGLTVCPNTAFAINADVLFQEVAHLENSACTAAREAPYFVQLAAGGPHQELYDHGSALHNGSVYLCSILNSFRTGRIGYVPASQQLAPQLCAVLSGMVGIGQYVSAHQNELAAIDAAVFQHVSQAMVNTQNLGRLVLRMQ
jgi:protease YdgD